MNKDIKRLLSVSVLLILISSIIIIAKGNTYTARFNIAGSDNYKLDIEDKNGAVKILEEKVVNNEYLVKVKAIRPGKVHLYFDLGDYTVGNTLYVHKTSVITDNTFFGKSNYSEVIPISISIILIYSIYILVKRYKHSIKDNLYQYKNIAYLGIIIFLSFFTVNNIFSIFHYQGIYGTISELIASMNLVSFFLLPIAVITFILVTISNIVLIIKEGKSLKNLLGLFLGVFICLLTLLPDYIYRLLLQSQVINIYNLNGPGPYIYNFFESLVYLIIAYLECILIGTIIIGIKSVKKKVDYNKDYIIILGCKIKKDGTLTPLLKGRVDKALEFRNKQLELTNKDLIFIPSGGKGSDETISESLSMKNYLIEKGIKEKNILLEDKSTNTYENIKFSNKLIKNKNANILFSTTNYHVLRAGLIATEQGILMEGIGSNTKSYFWINAFIREFIGTLYKEKKKHIIVFISIVLVLIFMIFITYLANNI